MSATFPIPTEVSLEFAKLADPQPAKLTAFAPGMVWVELLLSVQIEKDELVHIVFREEEGSCLGMAARVVWSAVPRVALSVENEIDRTVLAQWALGKPADLEGLMAIHTTPSSSAAPERPRSEEERQRAEIEEEAGYTGALDMPWNAILQSSRPKTIDLPRPPELDAALKRRRAPGQEEGLNPWLMPPQ